MNTEATSFTYPYFLKEKSCSNMVAKFDQSGF